MRRVLHVGPVQSKGGMQATIHHHLEHPPPGWQTEAISTHVDGSILSKLNAWIQAKSTLKNRLRDDPPDLVHVHTATRFSWWRKRRAVTMSVRAGIPTVLQVHSGNFDAFLTNRPSAATTFRSVCAEPLVTPVALTPRHKDLIGIPDMAIIGSPAPESDPVDAGKRIRNKLLMLSRASRIKGHDIAIMAVHKLRNSGIEIDLHLSGINANHPGVMRVGGVQSGIHARGWVSDEEKEDLLRTAGLLLIPSQYEGMPVAAMEALSCGLPVLASRSCEGILGEGGRIVGDLTVNSWAEAISNVLEDEEAWITMCESGPQAVVEQTPESLGHKWAELYNSAVRGGE